MPEEPCGSIECDRQGRVVPIAAENLLRLLLLHITNRTRHRKVSSRSSGSWILEVRKSERAEYGLLAFAPSRKLGAGIIQRLIHSCTWHLGWENPKD